MAEEAPGCSGVVIIGGGIEVLVGRGIYVANKHALLDLQHLALRARS